MSPAPTHEWERDPACLAGVCDGPASDDPCRECDGPQGVTCDEVVAYDEVVAWCPTHQAIHLGCDTLSYEDYWHA